MSNTGLVVLVAGLGICVALAATNPTTQEYGAFLESLLGTALEQTDPADSAHERNLIRNLLKSQGKTVIESVIRPNTRRRNYGLFSIFETRAFDVHVVIVGVGGVFVPVDGVEDATRKLGQIVLTPAR
ncbi:MAG: DUF4359 domain-containing protein [Nitrospirae bacterium]|nr:DUF4359 domain-containing protein [Nitrospirota bacterium]